MKIETLVKKLNRAEAEHKLNKVKNKTILFDSRALY